MKMNKFILVCYFLLHSASTIANSCMPADAIWKLNGEDVNAGDTLKLTVGGFIITHTADHYTKSADIWPHYLIMEVNKIIPAGYAIGRHQIDYFDIPAAVNDQIIIFEANVPVTLAKNNISYTTQLELAPIEATSSFASLNIPYIIKGAGTTSYQTEIFISADTEQPLSVGLYLVAEGQDPFLSNYSEYSETGDNISYSGIFSDANDPLMSNATLTDGKSGSIILNSVGSKLKLSGSIFVYSDRCSKGSIKASVTQTIISPENTTYETNYLAGGNDVPLVMVE